jgi:hypothetical protein
MVAPERTQVLPQRVESVDLCDNCGERMQEPVALHGHRYREKVPALGMAQEQVRVEEQRDRVAMHGHTSEGIPESLNVQRAPSPDMARYGDDLSI